MHGTVHLLTFSGNQPGASASAAMLRAFSALVPSTFTVSHYDGLERLPRFDPNLTPAEAPPEVADWREQVAQADALVISTPEATGGLPGAFLNALDWLVGSATIMGKRVALLSVSCGSALAEEALSEALSAMSAAIIPEASAHLDLPNARWDERAIIAQAHLRRAIFKSIDAIADAVAAAT